jgi:hypothetical protein
VHCSRVFRSSVPSDHLPYPSGKRPWGADREPDAAEHSLNGMGGRPRWQRAAAGIASGRWPDGPAARAAGAGPLLGEGRTMRDPELVARAQRAAARLESAWEQWRALHGLAVAPGQPVVSYVGYSLKEPWGEPRVVIGVDADEAEFLADFLDRDECANAGQFSSGPLQQALLADQAQPPEGEYTSQALLGAPVSLGLGHQTAGSGGDIAADLAGWSSGELPGQASERLAGWPPGRTSPGLAADQPPGA